MIIDIVDVLLQQSSTLIVFEALGLVFDLEGESSKSMDVCTRRVIGAVLQRISRCILG
jgi:hypothetical protein